jgi:site-specific DNA-methyltransferase (adenine-specific)
MWFRKNSRLKKKNLITWSKMDENDKRLNGMILKRLNAGQSRKYYRGLTEYILLYAFQDSTGLDVVRKNVDNFPELRKYFYDMLEYIGKTRNQINDQLGHRKAEHCFYVSRKTIIDEIDGKADHYFRYGSSQWALPTKKTYQELIDTYKIDEWKGFRDYEGLVRDYEELVRDYETKRYTFNTIKKEYDGTIRSAQQNNCVQIYKPVNTMKSGHATPKPVEMIENFILHSTNEGDLVLDPFGGSGTTALACIRTNRNCIIVEREKEYIDLIEKNIEIEKKLKKLGKIGERVHVKTRKLRQLQLFK